MTEQQFDLKLKQIDEQYQARREAADAWRDQEKARLFETCEWTQEKIAQRMGKKQQWVSRHLIFGRFLSFTPNGVNAEQLNGLTEGRFRGYWRKTEGKEKERFTQVANIVANGIPQGHDARITKPGVKPAVLKALDDGQWYSVEEIQAEIEGSLLGVTPEQISGALRNTKNCPPKGKVVEAKIAKGRSQYRLIDRGESTLSPIEVLYDKAVPLLDELEQEAKKHMAEWSPSTVRKIAVQLRRLFESVLEESIA